MSTNFEDIRSILNRIDGVNVPTDEAKSGIEDHDYKLLMLDISAMKDRIAELNYYFKHVVKIPDDPKVFDPNEAPWTEWKALLIEESKT